MISFIKKNIYKLIIFFYYDRVKIKKKKIYSSVNKKPKFLLISNLNSLGGMFSNLKIVLNGICEAKKRGLKPEVDMENFPTLYNDKDIKYTKNSWLYYFSPLSVGLRKVLKLNFLINENNKIKYNLIYNNKKKNTYLKKIYLKYISINKEFLITAETFFKKNFSNKKVIAVHFRGTDAKITPSHKFPPTLEQVDNFLSKYLRENEIDHIFFITDQLSYLDYFKKKYKKKLLYWKSFRSNKYKIFNLKVRRKHNYKLGKDNIIEMLILSKIDTIIYSNSNLVEFAIFHSNLKRIRSFQLENGINSKNILISLFLWNLKKLLPKNIGGFNKSAKIKEYLIK